MSGKFDDRHKQWLTAWQNAGSEMERLRREALAYTDVATAIECLSEAFDSALLHASPALTSGLVVQQQLFQKLRSA